MGQPTIYKPSIYNGNWIYKNGAGGGGDFSTWFREQKQHIVGDLLINPNTKTAYPLSASGPTACFSIDSFLDISNVSKIEFQMKIKLFKENSSSSGKDVRIFTGVNYPSSGTGKRIGYFFINSYNGRVVFVPPNASNNGFGTAVEILSSIDLTNYHTYKLEFNLDTLLLDISIDDNYILSTPLNSKPNEFQPAFGCINFNVTSYFETRYFKYGTTIDLSKSYFKLDDNLILGFD